LSGSGAGGASGGGVANASAWIGCGWGKKTFVCAIEIGSSATGVDAAGCGPGADGETGAVRAAFAAHPAGTKQAAASEMKVAWNFIRLNLPKESEE
jgi:hypothetical protein